MRAAELGACRGEWYGYGQRAWSPVRAVQLITGIAAPAPGAFSGSLGAGAGTAVGVPVVG